VRTTVFNIFFVRCIYLFADNIALHSDYYQCRTMTYSLVSDTQWRDVPARWCAVDRRRGLS
jgi:hypothetical protein